MTLGEKICALRTVQGLSQTDLAEALEVSRQSVSKWETAASVPDLDRLVSICKLFQVSLDELVLGECPEAPEKSPEEQEDAPAMTAVPRRSLQTALMLFCTAGVVALLGLLLAGPYGLVLSIPCLVCGCIALTRWRHRVLWCVWTVVGLAALSLPYLTGITWGWGVALVCLGLLSVTVWLLRKESWSHRLPERVVVPGCLACIAGGTLWAHLIRPELIETLRMSGMLSWVLLLFLPDVLCLLLLTVAAVSFGRWLHRRQRTETL